MVFIHRLGPELEFRGHTDVSVEREAPGGPELEFRGRTAVSVEREAPGCDGRRTRYFHEFPGFYTSVLVSRECRVGQCRSRLPSVPDPSDYAGSGPVRGET